MLCSYWRAASWRAVCQLPGVSLEGGDGELLGGGVAVEDLKVEFVVAALGLGLLLELGVGPGGGEVGPHEAEEGDDGVGGEVVEGSEDLAEGFEAPDLGLGVGGDEGLGEFVFEGFAGGFLEAEGADFADEGGEFLEVAFLLGAGEGDGLGAGVVAVVVGVGGAVVVVGVGVVVVGPDFDEVAGEGGGGLGVFGGELLEVGVGEVVLAGAEVEGGGEGGDAAAGVFIEEGGPFFVGEVVDDLAGLDGGGLVGVVVPFVVPFLLALVVGVAVGVPLHLGAEGGGGVVLGGVGGFVDPVASEEVEHFPPVPEFRGLEGVGEGAGGGGLDFDLLEAEGGVGVLAGLGGGDADGGHDLEAVAFGFGEGLVEPFLAGLAADFGDEGEGAVEGGGAFLGGGGFLADEGEADFPGLGEVVFFAGFLFLFGFAFDVLEGVFGVEAGEEVEGGVVLGCPGFGGFGEAGGGLLEEAGLDEEAGGALAGGGAVGAEVAGAFFEGLGRRVSGGGRGGR